MYDSGASHPAISLRSLWRARRWPAVHANVWYLGVTSLLTDVSSEMVTSVLPIYIVLHLQMSPLAFGAMDGLYQGVSALVRTASAFVADRQRHHKAMATLGYGVSALAKLGYLAAGAFWFVLPAVIVGDRLGKGIRTAPRDALIAQNAVSGELATAFGAHRAMDAAGAALGPLAAFAILAFVPGRFDQVFVASFGIALMGLGALVLLVDGPGGPASAGRPAPLSVARAWDAMASPDFRMLLLAACAVSLATVSDALLYLVLQRQSAFDASRLPLLFVGTPICYFVLAGPMGVLADRFDPKRLFVAGHLPLVLVYAVLWLAPGSAATIGVCLVLLGAYYAATDGVLAAVASRVLPADVRATGLSVLATGTSVARALAALVFGAVWTFRGSDVATAVFAVALLAGIAAAGVLLAHGRLRREGR